MLSDPFLRAAASPLCPFSARSRIVSAARRASGLMQKRLSDRCDQDHFEDDVKEYTAKGYVTRREFDAMAAGAGLMFLLPGVTNAQAVRENEVNVTTPDGTCDAS
jgi:hypothetical protein